MPCLLFSGGPVRELPPELGGKGAAERPYFLRLPSGSCGSMDGAREDTSFSSVFSLGTGVKPHEAKLSRAQREGWRFFSASLSRKKYYPTP